MLAAKKIDHFNAYRSPDARRKEALQIIYGIRWDLVP